MRRRRWGSTVKSVAGPWRRSDSQPRFQFQR
ncbi:hypothetical protein BS78_06G242000 [Paspalum vaginatum]|nr:hypothetical protein BS78_06G242000 [Paspalum vaginatum]